MLGVLGRLNLYRLQQERFVLPFLFSRCIHRQLVTVLQFPAGSDNNLHLSLLAKLAEHVLVEGLFHATVEGALVPRPSAAFPAHVHVAVGGGCTTRYLSGNLAGLRPASPSLRLGPRAPRARFTIELST